MEQTSTLCHEAVTQIPEPAPVVLANAGAPTERTIRSILEFSRNLEVKPSTLVEHVSFMRS